MKKSITTFGILLAIGLIVVGIFFPIPDKKISTYSFSENGYNEYVGGDAYNIQIEASLRGGQIAGATAAKAVFISSGVVLLFLTIVIDYVCKEKTAKYEEIKLYVQRITDNTYSNVETCKFIKDGFEFKSETFKNLDSNTDIENNIEANDKTTKSNEIKEKRSVYDNYRYCEHCQNIVSGDICPVCKK